MADFQKHLGDLETAGGELFALSTDPFDKAKGTVELLGLTFPVLFGLEGAKTAALLGAFHETMRDIIQPANFVLNLDRSIAHLSIASGPIGRFAAEDAVRYVKSAKEKAQAAKGG